ncbi:MAG TPA: capsule assembly Wzi family protein [Prolixibacteraceae bacterium]|nr:capsule assembly Wzi family protein [Prolixibacteraceae bacterium]
MFKSLCLIGVMFLFSGLEAQTTDSEPTAYASFYSYASTGKELPFWFRANQNGVFPLANSTTQLFRAGFYKGLDFSSSNSWDYFYGADLVAGYAGDGYFQANQYWVGARFLTMVLKVGAMADSIRFGGLSSSNGNMYASNNARPVPKITLSTNGYQYFRFLPGWLSVKGLYEEGMLWDSSFVQDAHLHHKNFHFRVDLPDRWNFSLGIEHYVFWGGVSPTQGRYPGWEEYFRYVFGLEGGSGATESDQINVSGNQLGMYNLEINKIWRNNQLTFYWNHPFEDHSGMELFNLPDGLWGVHWGQKKQQKIVTDVVYEWMYTLDQTGNPQVYTIRGGDNYFNHGEYQSGFTHFAGMMGTPLFVPALKTSEVSAGFESTRMWMHHLGIKGALLEDLSWKAMCTYSRNYGSYGNVYSEPLSQLSVMGQFVYRFQSLPLELSAALANDSGDRFENRTGFSFGLKWMPQEDIREKHREWVIRRKFRW